MSDDRPLARAARAAPVEGEVLESGARRVADAPNGPAGGALEPALRAIHGLLLGGATLCIVLPAVILVVAVIVPSIVLWLVVSALLRVVFGLLALATGSRPAAVMPGAVLRARAVRGFSGFSRAWGTTPDR